jgi:hypothetical protein
MGRSTGKSIQRSQTCSLSGSSTGTPNLNKWFFPYVYKRSGTAVGFSLDARVMLLNKPALPLSLPPYFLMSHPWNTLAWNP